MSSFDTLANLVNSVNSGDTSSLRVLADFLEEHADYTKHFKVEAAPYLVNCQLYGERKGDYKKAKQIAKLFEFTEDEMEHSCGNIAHCFQVDRKTLKCSFRPDMGGMDFSEEKYVSLYKAIPSALLMYRLACLFKGKVEVNGQEGYKVVWSMTLKHKKTGTLVNFGEWKGASEFFMQFSETREVPEEFQKDFVFLMNYLLSDTCAHPYDGLVAGGVA